MDGNHRDDDSGNSQESQKINEDTEELNRETQSRGERASVADGQNAPHQSKDAAMSTTPSRGSGSQTGNTSGMSLANLERDVLAKSTERMHGTSSRPGAVAVGGSPSGVEGNSLRQLESEIESKRRGSTQPATRPGAVSVPGNKVDAAPGKSQKFTPGAHTSIPGAHSVPGPSSLTTLNNDDHLKHGSATNPRDVAMEGQLTSSGSGVANSLQQLESDVEAKRRGSSQRATQPGALSVPGTQPGAVSIPGGKEDALSDKHRVSTPNERMSTPGAHSVSGPSSLAALEHDVLMKRGTTPRASSIAGEGLPSVSGHSNSLQQMESEIEAKRRGNTQPATQPGAVSVSGRKDGSVAGKGQTSAPGAHKSLPGGHSVTGPTSLAELENDLLLKHGNASNSGAVSMGGPLTSSGRVVGNSLQQLESEIEAKRRGSSQPATQPGVVSVSSRNDATTDKLNTSTPDVRRLTPGAHSVAGASSLAELENDVLRKGQPRTSATMESTSQRTTIPGAHAVSGSTLFDLEREVVRKNQSIGGTPGTSVSGARSVAGSASLHELEQDVVRKGKGIAAASSGTRDNFPGAQAVDMTPPAAKVDSYARQGASLTQLEEDALSKLHARTSDASPSTLARMEADIAAKARASSSNINSSRGTSLSQLEQDALAKMRPFRPDGGGMSQPTNQPPVGLPTGVRSGDWVQGEAPQQEPLRSNLGSSLHEPRILESLSTVQIGRIGIGIMSMDEDEENQNPQPATSASIEAQVSPPVVNPNESHEDWHDSFASRGGSAFAAPVEAAPDMVLSADTVLTATTAVVVPGEEEKVMERRKILRYTCLAGTVIVIAIVGVIVAVSGGDGGGSTLPSTPTDSPTLSAAPSSVPSLAPTTSDLLGIFEALRPFYSDDEYFDEVFENRESAQFAAADWLANEDNYPIELSEAKLMQRFVLACFYFALGGDNWNICSRNDPTCGLGGGETSWLTATDECSWVAVKCNDAGSVITIYFYSQDSVSLATYPYGLRGTLPNELNLLTTLSSLVLDKNYIHGTLPEWPGLSTLQILKVGTNELTGTIPATILMQNSLLGTLEFEENKLTGSIPWAVLPASIRDLQLGKNNFDGSISSVARLTNLRYLDVEYNQLSGTIPSEFFNLPQIQELRLGGNVGLSGVIDGDMFRNASTLTELTLFDAPAVSGSFPSEMFDLPSLSVIDVHSCSITGTLSEDFSRLSLLESLIVHNNTLRGTIPSAFDGLLNLRDLLFHSNNLSGTISAAVCERKGLDFGEIRNLTADCAISDVEELPKVSCSCCKCF